jgi:hypothetical protein
MFSRGTSRIFSSGLAHQLPIRITGFAKGVPGCRRACRDVQVEVAAEVEFWSGISDVTYRIAAALVKVRTRPGAKSRDPTGPRSITTPSGGEELLDNFTTT